jgi:FdhD protein
MRDPRGLSGPAGSWRSSVDPERVTSVQVTHWQGQEPQPREDVLTVEEPLEIRLSGRDEGSLAVIMRTPGNDRELVAGFLYSEGIVTDSDDILVLEEAIDDDGLPLANVINVTLRPDPHGRGAIHRALVARSTPGQGRDESRPNDGLAMTGGAETAAVFERHFTVSASCGLCGRNSIADLMCRVAPLPRDELRIAASALYTLSDRLREQQAIFAHTGGLHAAGLFTTDGQLLLLREDVGRHNAVDKLVGHGLLHGALPYERHILLVSGRTSFEIIQKALLARIPCVAAISAPSSLAVELAHEGGITLIGFLRERGMNVYTHPERVL